MLCVIDIILVIGWICLLCSVCIHKMARQKLPVPITQWNSSVVIVIICDIFIINRSPIVLIPWFPLEHVLVLILIC